MDGGRLLHEALAAWACARAGEEHHRGRLAPYARLQGRVPALTRRIRGG